MAIYEYTARDETGKVFRGTCDEIDNVAALREDLAKTGYALVKARRWKRSANKGRRIKRSEVVSFAYKFAGMYSAGLPILRCLETFEQQMQNEAFGSVITSIREDLETGASLEKAFGKHRDIFSDFLLGMVEAGESAGELGKALEMSAAYLEKQADLRRKVQSAFAYPIAVCVVCLLAIVGLLIFIIPIFMKLYKQLRVALPMPTQVLVELSAIVRNDWWQVLIVAAVVSMAIVKLSRNAHVRAKWDVFKLNMPVFGELNRMVVVSRFIRTFAMLASVGVSLTRALEVASTVAHNSKLAEITKELQERIEAGNPVAGSLKDYDIFPPMIVQLAASGEEVGALAEMLNKGVDFLDKDINRTVNALLVKLEPALTVIAGAIVGFLLMAVYLPMFDYMSHLE